METKQLVAELLEIIKNGLLEGSKIVQEQAPILCNQILRWGIVNNLISTIISVVGMLVSYEVVKFCGVKYKKNADKDPIGWVILSVIIAIVGIGFLISFCSSILEIAKILSAPNLFILDYLKGLISK